MKFDENLAAVHAYLCADGYVIKNSLDQKSKYYHVGFRNTNLILLKDFQKRFFNYFKVKPRLREGERCVLGSKELYEKLTKEFGSFYSKDWSVPKLNKNLIKVWLRAFFDCEGWVYCKTHQNRKVGLESINGKGIYQIKEKLDVLGINCKVKKRNTKNIYSLGIYGKENLLKFEKEIGFLHPEKTNKPSSMVNDFMNYDWIFPTETDELNLFLKQVMKEKAKMKRPNGIFRIVSKKEQNLLHLRNKLIKLFGIESRLNKRRNGLGTEYFELSINKNSEINKLISNGLLKEESIREWRRLKK
jgi:hypothetical protein